MAALGDGSAVTPPIVEPDDPGLLAREAAKARVAEEKEYAERRRVKTWKTLENGSRVPGEFWSEEELAAIEAQANRFAAGVTTPPFSWGFNPETGEHIKEDPVKQASKRFKAALRGRHGPKMERLAWAFTEMLEDGK